MRMCAFRTCLFTALGAASLLSLSATAQTAAPPTATAEVAVAPTAPVRLPYGVEDVLKLTRAQVSEEVTLNFIHNSGTIYNLSPNDIVYLRNQGVSDRVINTMLDQRKNVPAETAAQSAPPAVPAPPAQAAPQYAPAYTEPQPVYPPASTVYVIPDSGSGYGYNSYYPYYYGGYYPSYFGSSFVFSFGSGGHYGGSYYGGHYGGSGHYYSGGGRYGYHGHH